MIRKLMSLYQPKRGVSLGRGPLARFAPLATLDPRVKAHTLHSVALGITKRFYVYTPPGYSRRNAALPTLYLFRGHEHEWINRAQDTTRGNRTVIDVYEELLQGGTVGPMILVFPGISSDDNSIPGLLVNFKQPALTQKPGIGHGRFEDYFMHELVPAIDIHYRTNSQARGVDGFSLGGFMSVKIAAQHADAFRTVGAYDGLYFWDDPNDAHSIADTDRTFGNPMFDPAFGAREQRDRRYAARHNPMNLVRNGDPHLLQRLTWLIEYGPRTGEPGDSNFYRGARLSELLANQGIANQGRGEITTSRHNWQCADEHMRYVLPLHWNALQQT